jgi:hypothetical protein
MNIVQCRGIPAACACALSVPNSIACFYEMADVPTVERKSEQSLTGQERKTVFNVFNHTKA